MSKGKYLKGKIEGRRREVLTHEDTLRILSEMARNGSVTAAVALARELRLTRATKATMNYTPSWTGSSTAWMTEWPLELPANHADCSEV